MEQLLLYVVTISGFSGLMLGLYSLLVPVLQKRGINLPFIGRGPDDEGYEYEFEDEDASRFGASAFGSRRTSLLQPVPRRGSRSPEPEDEYEEDEYLDDEGDERLGDLDLSREKAEVAAEEAEDEELAELTFEAEVDPVLDAFTEEDDEDEIAEDGELDEDGEDEEEDGDEEDEDYEDDEEDEEEQESIPAVVQVVPAGATDSNDMLALFDEADDAGKEIETWRGDLPDVSMADVLADAREINELLRGRRRPA